MKYVSIDIESTGIDPDKDQVLSIGLVIEDSNDIKPVDELPSLHLVIVRDRLEGNVFALDMNRDIVKLLKDYQIADDVQRMALAEAHEVIFVKEYQIVEEIFDFLYVNDMVNPRYNVRFDEGTSKFKGDTLIPTLGNIVYQTTLTIAGKNVAGFAVPFLKKLPRFTEIFKFHQRVIDPAILFVDWEKDELLPNLNTCMKRAGVEGEVTHDAVEDCKDVIKVLRTKY